MKSDPAITSLVCAPHCRFYRPGQKEELSCAGYDFFVRWCSQEVALLCRRLFGEARPPERFEPDPRLEAALCRGCGFAAEDCDFAAGAQEDAVPCGGYVLLARLLAAGFSPVESWLERETRP